MVMTRTVVIMYMAIMMMAWVIIATNCQRYLPSLYICVTKIYSVTEIILTVSFHGHDRAPAGRPPTGHWPAAGWPPGRPVGRPAGWSSRRSATQDFLTPTVEVKFKIRREFDRRMLDSLAAPLRRAPFQW